MELGAGEACNQHVVLPLELMPMVLKPIIPALVHYCLCSISVTRNKDRLFLPRFLREAMGDAITTSKPRTLSTHFHSLFRSKNLLTF